MAAANYNQCYARVRIHEGGNDDDPRDPGGRTSRGIIQREWNVFRSTHPGRPADVWKASEEDIATIYRLNYWDALRCDSLPGGVDDEIFDYGVNSGIGRSGKVLRRLLGLPDNDWHVTDQVLAAVTLRDVAALIRAIAAERMRFLRSLSTFDHFGMGWTRRVNEVTAFSLQLAAGKAPQQPPANDNVQKAGKGHVAPPPKTGKMQAGGGAAAVSGAGLIHWIGGHPELTALVVVGGIAVTVVLVKVIESRHRARQEAPTPGTAVVPVKQAA